MKTLNQSIISIRVSLQNAKLKKSGRNKFAGFDYFELSDFLPKLNELMLEEDINDRYYIKDGYKEVKDYDMFLKNDELIEDLKKLDIWSFSSDYALTCGKYQVVIKYFGEPDFCVGQFDFKHNMHYYIPNTQKILCAYLDEFFEDEPDFEDFRYLQTNELFFNENRARDIEGVYLRVGKFTKRGMTISKKTKKQIEKRITKKSVNAYKKTRSSGGKSYY